MQNAPRTIPAETDLLIIGSGTGGATLAGIVARDTDHRVTLVEAGPDYGPPDRSVWPADLLDPRPGATSHDWGYEGIAHSAQPEPINYWRARVIGGCSSHNYCNASVGHRCDYDGWANMGNPGWNWDSVAPAFDRAKEAMRVHTPSVEELTPYHVAYLDGAAEVGIPRVSEFNNPDEAKGVAPFPVNVSDGMRWNSAFAYIDPVRHKPNLNIVDNALVERVVLEGSKATAVEVFADGQRHTIRARRIVVAGGAYCSPAILMRSGIGDPDQLHRIGINTLHSLPGVGQNLTDHPLLLLLFNPTDKLEKQMAQLGGTARRSEVRTMAKIPSPHCSEGFDLDLISRTLYWPDTDEMQYGIVITMVAPRSRGRLTLTSADPEAKPVIDIGYLTDGPENDLNAVVDGVEISRSIGATIARAGLIDGEKDPGVSTSSRQGLGQWVQRTVNSFAHPSCTCRMGPASDNTAVVDHNGKVHGIDSLYVCDASIFPVVMRAPTNLPTAMVAEHLAARIGDIR